MTHPGSVQREPLNELVRKARGPVGDHPGQDEIVRYRTNDLPAEDMDRLQEHFVRCPDCRELLLLRSTADDSGVIDFGLVPAWRAMRKRIRRDRWQLPLVVAAAALLLVVGLSAQKGFQLSSMVTQLSQPQVTVVHELTSRERLLQSRTRGASALRHRVDVPVGVDSVTFVFQVDPVKVFEKAEAYPVEIVDASGRSVWSKPNVQIDPLSTANLGVPRAFLDSGDYDVLIYKSDDSLTRQLIDIYPVTLRFLDQDP